MAWMLFATTAHAYDVPTFAHHPKNPICAQDLSSVRVPMIRGVLGQPDGLVDRGLRPSLAYMQQEVCHCLPRNPRRQPAEILVQLHIRPNAGEVTLEYRVEPPWSRSVTRMMQCLGEPTLTVEPMDYRSDMITPEGRADEVLDYPVRLELWEEGVRRGRSQRSASSSP